MSQAPERIMAYGEINSKWGVQFKCQPMPMQGKPSFPLTEYVRADRIKELKAKLAKAVKLMELSVELATWNTTLLEDVIDFITELKGQDDE